MATEKPTNERLAIIETRLANLEADMNKERTDRKAMATILFTKIDHASDRIGGLEKHLWFAIGAATAANFLIQLFLK